MHSSKKYIDSISPKDNYIPNPSPCGGEYPICEQVQFITEGIDSILTSIGEWISRYKPRDPTFRKLDSAYNRVLEKCMDLHVDGSGDVKDISFEEYLQSPKYSKCVLTSQVTLAEAMIKILKNKKPEVLCNSNSSPVKCMSWLNDHLHSLEMDLKEAKFRLKQLPIEGKRIESAKALFLNIK